MSRKKNATVLVELVNFYRKNIQKNIPLYARACLVSMHRVRTYQTTPGTEGTRKLMYGTRRTLINAAQGGNPDPYIRALSHIDSFYTDVERRIDEASRLDFKLRDGNTNRLRTDIETLFNVCLYLDNLRHNLRTQPETDIEHARMKEIMAGTGGNYNPDIAEVYHNSTSGELRDWELYSLTPPVAMLCHPTNESWAGVSAAWRKKFPKEAMPWLSTDFINPLSIGAVKTPPDFDGDDLRNTLPVGVTDDV